MARWKVAGALVNPKGSRMYLQVPSWLFKVVFYWSSTATGICQ